MVECANTTGRVCKSPEEIQQFVRTAVIKVSVLKTVVVEGHYEKRGEIDHNFRDIKNSDFYPLLVSTDRLYLNTLMNYDTY